LSTSNTEQAFRKKSFYENMFLMTLLFGLISVVLLYLHHRWSHSPDSDLVFISEICKEAGFAVLVAVVLNISIEGVNRRRHHDLETSLAQSIDKMHEQRITAVLEQLRGEHDSLLKELGEELEAKHSVHRASLLADLDTKYNETSTNLLKDVFRTVYERYIEPGVFQVIDNHVLKKEVMRKAFRAELAMRPLGGDNPDQLIKLGYSQSYTVVNLTDRKIITDLIGATIDVTPAYEGECRFSYAKIGVKEFSAEEIARSVVKDDQNALWTIRISGELQPREKIDVSLGYSKVAPATYSEVILTTVQMDSLELETICFMDELDVSAVSLHPDDAERMPNSILEESMSWKINHSILPGQGIVVFWHKKRQLRELQAAEEAPVIELQKQEV
jgi:hypothetical protein